MGPLLLLAPSRAFWASFLARRMRARVGQEAGEGGGGFGPGVLGSGLAVASEQEEEQGFQGSLEVGGWQEGQDAGE